MFSLAYIQQQNALYSKDPDLREDLFSYSDIAVYYSSPDLSEHWRTNQLDDGSHIVITCNGELDSAFSICWHDIAGRQGSKIAFDSIWSLDDTENIIQEIQRDYVPLLVSKLKDRHFWLKYQICQNALVLGFSRHVSRFYHVTFSQDPGS